MGCPSQTELGPDPGSTVRAVRPRASHCPSPRAFLIWETGVLILLFSPSWPLLLVMCRKEMVFFTLPLCRVGVNSSGSTANSPHAFPAGSLLLGPQGERMLTGVGETWRWPQVDRRWGGQTRKHPLRIL